MSRAARIPHPLVLLVALAGLSAAAGCGGTGTGNPVTPPAGPWSAAEDIDAGTGTASSPSLAVDPTTGDAFAVWVQVTAGGRDAVFASRFDATSLTWSEAEVIDAGDAGGEASEPQVAADRNGRAYAVWLQGDGGVQSVWAAVYTGTWQPAELLEALSTPASEPRIAAGATGMAVAAWIQQEGVTRNVLATRAEAPGAWEAPVVLDPDDNDEDAAHPAVAVAGNGDAFVVWTQPDNTARRRLHASVRPATGEEWLTFLEPIDQPAFPAEVADPAIAADDSGRAIAVWRQNAAVQSPAIWWAALTARPVPGFSLADVVSASSNPAGPPALAMNGNGTAVAAWHEVVGARTDVLAARFRPLPGTWTPPAVVDDSNVGSAANPVVAVDDAGNALALWEEGAPAVPSVLASLLPAAGSTWGNAESLEDDHANAATSPRVGLDDAGNAVAVWVQSGRIRASTRR